MKEWFKLNPTWVKGGIVAVGMYILLSIILFPIPIGVMVGLGIALSVPGFIIASIFLGRGGYDHFLPVIIFSSVIYFIIGAFIGWIIAKIKSKRVK
ncbi:MAG: hypothetical protein GWO79_00075 [Actinobacteria bacterium]|nr:hypothetical protein [Actinomycetota bacterium]